MTKASDRARKLMLLTGVTGVTLVLVSVAAEHAVRFRERHRTITPDNHTTMYYRTAYLPHALVRDYDYFGWLRVNGQGFRGPDVSVAKPEGVFRVIALGGSTTFDTAISPDEDAWPARLAHWLGEESPGLKVEVINAGVSGYTVLDNTIRLQMDVHRFDPDLIILYHTHNNLGAAVRPPRVLDPRRPREIPTATPWGQWLERHSLFYNKLLLKWRDLRYRTNQGDIRGRPDAAVRFDELLEQGSTQFRRELRWFLATAKTLDIPVVLPSVVHVSGDRLPDERHERELRAWRRTHPTAPVDVTLRAYRRFAQEIRDAAEEAGVPYVDTGTFGLVGWEHFNDVMHFNKAGADRMGAHMARALIEAGVVPTSGPIAGSASQP